MAAFTLEAPPTQAEEQHRRESEGLLRLRQMFGAVPLTKSADDASTVQTWVVGCLPVVCVLTIMLLFVLLASESVTLIAQLIGPVGANYTVDFNITIGSVNQTNASRL